MGTTEVTFSVTTDGQTDIDMVELVAAMSAQVDDAPGVVSWKQHLSREVSVTDLRKGHRLVNVGEILGAATNGDRIVVETRVGALIYARTDVVTINL